MAVSDPSQEIDLVRTLLEQYFDLGICEVDAVMADWLYRFDIAWVLGAALEALYQGRYKLVSVSQILQLWSRRGQPLRHYSREFEAIIAGQPVLFAGLPLAGLPLPEAPVQSRASTSALSPAAQPLAQTDLYNPFLPQLPPQPGPPIQSEPNKADRSAQAPGAALEPTFEPLTTEPLTTALQPEPMEPALPLPVAATEPAKIEPFKPDRQWGYKPISWVGSPVNGGTGHPEPIQPFVPELNSLELDQRLRAVARRPASLP